MSLGREVPRERGEGGVGGGGVTGNGHGHTQVEHTLIP